jgi:cyclophilin family peptidyl-prolyl cis-trans isomerase
VIRGRSRLLLAGGAVALAVGLAACGGSDDGDDDEGAAAGTPTTAEAPADVPQATTDADGNIVCTDEEPDPPPDPDTYDEPPELVIDEALAYTATMQTSCGEIVIALDAENAPNTVNNFVFLSEEGFYDGLTFHRVVPDFVIQGGDPAGDGTGGPGYEFGDELPEDGYPEGAVAMANAGPDTNGSQFFIVSGNAAALPNSFSRFGEVTEGIEVAEAIEGLGDPATEQPSQPVYIYDVSITTG